VRRGAPEESAAAPVRGRWREDAAAFAVLALAAAIFTWPLALDVGGAIPAGGGPPTVALFGLFSMEWTGQALAEGRPYWDAPFFHPHRDTFAWSETQPATALAVAALSRVVGSSAAYGLVLWPHQAPVHRELDRHQQGREHRHSQPQVHRGQAADQTPCAITSRSHPHCGSGFAQGHRNPARGRPGVAASPTPTPSAARSRARSATVSARWSGAKGATISATW